MANKYIIKFIFLIIFIVFNCSCLFAQIRADFQTTSDNTFITNVYNDSNMTVYIGKSTHYSYSKKYEIYNTIFSDSINKFLLGIDYHKDDIDTKCFIYNCIKPYSNMQFYAKWNIRETALPKKIHIRLWYVYTNKKRRSPASQNKLINKIRETYLEVIAMHS